MYWFLRCQWENTFLQHSNAADVDISIYRHFPNLCNIVALFLYSVCAFIFDNCFFTHFYISLTDLIVLNTGLNLNSLQMLEREKIGLLNVRSLCVSVSTKKPTFLTLSTY